MWKILTLPNIRRHILQQQKWKISWFIYLTLFQSLIPKSLFWKKEKSYSCILPFAVNWPNKSIQGTLNTEHAGNVFIYIISNPYNNSARKGLTSSFYREKNWGSKRYSSSFNITHPIRGGVGTYTYICQTLKSVFFFLPLCLSPTIGIFAMMPHEFKRHFSGSFWLRLYHSARYLN